MDKQELIDRFYENMNVAKRAMHGGMHALVGDHSISRSQMELLFTLKHLQPTSPKQLGAEMHLTAGAVSQLLESLVEQGLVERHDDPTDRRSQQVKISKSGQKKMAAIAEKRNKIMREVLKDLTTEELKVLLSVQDKLAKNFVRISKEKETK